MRTRTRASPFDSVLIDVRSLALAESLLASRARCARSRAYSYASLPFDSVLIELPPFDSYGSGSATSASHT